MIIIVDDERTFANSDDAVYCRSSNEALALLARVYCDQRLRYADPIQELWLDHDLGDGDDIRIVVDFLTVLGDLEIDEINIHSQNPTTDWIVTTLSPIYGRNYVKRVPLPELIGE
jgi:hypothetical protein